MSSTRAAFSKLVAPKGLELAADRRWNAFPYLVVVMVLLTLVSLFHVWSRIRVVDLNLQLMAASRTLKNEQQENIRLRLEAASLKAPGRIEALAKGELGMQLPSEQQVVLVK